MQGMRGGLEERQLLPWADKPIQPELNMAFAKSKALADKAKALGQQIGKMPLTAHAGAEGGTVEPATAAGSQLIQNSLLLARIVGIEPVTK